MNDETDKLAAQMRNLKPSKTSRKAGLEAAMAAFNTEFAGETGSAAEKNTTSNQGLGDAPRPTGKPTTSVRVLIAALIVLPNMDELAGDLPVKEGAVSTEQVPAPQVANSVPEDGLEDMTVEAEAGFKSTEERADAADFVDRVTAEDIGELPDFNLNESLGSKTETKNPPTLENGIGSVDALLAEIRSADPKDIKEFQLFTFDQPLQRVAGIPSVTINRGTRIVMSGKRAPSDSPDETYNDLTLEEVPAEYKVETKEIVTKEATTPPSL